MGIDLGPVVLVLLFAYMILKFFGNNISDFRQSHRVARASKDAERERKGDAKRKREAARFKADRDLRKKLDADKRARAKQERRRGRREREREEREREEERMAAEKIARAKAASTPLPHVDQLVTEVFGKFTTTPLENKIRVHIKPDIPVGKLSKIVSKYSKVLHPSEILLIFDNTLFGSGKVGFLLTPYGIWHRTGLSPGNFCKYTDISSVETKNPPSWSFPEVIINGDFKVDIFPQRWDVGLALVDFLSRVTESEEEYSDIIGSDYLRWMEETLGSQGIDTASALSRLDPNPTIDDNFERVISTKYLEFLEGKLKSLGIDTSRARTHFEDQDQ